MLTCSELDLSGWLARDQILEVLDSQDEGLHLGACSHTGLPAAHGAIPPCVVKQQHLPYELPRAPQSYYGPGLAAGHNNIVCAPLQGACETI